MRNPGTIGSERARLDAFTVTSDDIRFRDQRDLMERPFFSLSKSRRTTPILYKANDIEVQVFGMPEHGMATIWDADVLIWAASQIVDAENNGISTSRFFRFTPYQLLAAIGRARGATEYRLLKSALARLQSTVIATTIRNGEHWRRQQFSWINEWEEMVTRSGRIEGMEFVLPEWFYRGVIDRSLVLTIDPAYFRLTGGIERWLYRIARKHAGHQAKGWTFEIRHLYAKSGSLARFSDFALDIRRIAARQPLPGYELTIECAAGSEMLQIVATKLSTWPVEKPVNPPVTSGAKSVDAPVTSGASSTGDQAHESEKPSDSKRELRVLNFNNLRESNCSGQQAVGENCPQARQTFKTKPHARPYAQEDVP
ncbi:replication initiator protein A [Acidocella facilis]|uniref:replication initiator protein A n=1 Tax=Acidocella facilis TaxID=525 RepID=UPI001F4383E7|nr:replication initiator protein A [Acidocella facilis]